MACTGELPPNTRSGQSFIHDPKARRRRSSCPAFAQQSPCNATRGVRRHHRADCLFQAAPQPGHRPRRAPLLTGVGVGAAGAAGAAATWALRSCCCMQVAGETEVKAQIKLRFIASTRQPVVIIRSFQLTQASSGWWRERRGDGAAWQRRPDADPAAAVPAAMSACRLSCNWQTLP